MEISSYHRTKGLETKQVFVFNFDSSYFEYYARDQNPSKCPNDIYVAVTRAKDHLVLLHHRVALAELITVGSSPVGNNAVYEFLHFGEIS